MKAYLVAEDTAVLRTRRILVNRSWSQNADAAEYRKHHQGRLEAARVSRWPSYRLRCRRATSRPLESEKKITHYRKKTKFYFAVNDLNIVGEVFQFKIRYISQNSHL